MQLDKTRIPIRERSIFEIMDLALRILWCDAWGIVVAFLVGCVPFAALNYWLLIDLQVFSSQSAEDYAQSVLLLMLVEYPFAVLPLTIHLGNWMFMQETRWFEIFKRCFRVAPQMFLLQGILRVLLLPWVITWFFLFAYWPYMSEIIVLEQTPLFGKPGRSIGTMQRAFSFHGPEFGRLLVRWITVVFNGLLLVLSGWFSVIVVHGLLMDKSAGMPWSDAAITIPSHYTIMLPIVTWIVIGYVTIVRFLCYLDLRIRREGWEIDLMLRAEKERRARRLT